MKLSYLLPNATDYRSDYSAEEIEICGVCDNTEDMQNGDVFIAKRGKNFDPLHLLSKMEQCGISAIILESGSLFLLQAHDGALCVSGQTLFGGKIFHVVGHLLQRLAGEVGVLRLFDEIVHRQGA